MRRRKSKRISKVLLPAVCVIALCAGLTGCGGEFSGEEHAVSESAVSGSAVSEAAVVEEDDQGEALAGIAPHRFATDKNFYMPAFDSKKDEFGDDISIVSGFSCIRKNDVNRKETVKIDKFRALLAVTEDSIFYLTNDTVNDSDDDIDDDTDTAMDSDTVWRMPIGKDKDGYDLPKKEEAEKLFEETEGIICDSGSFVYGSCITYVTYGGKDYEGKAVRYDWKTGKKSMHNLEGNIAVLKPVGEGKLIVANMYDGYSCWDIKSDTWTKFFKDEEARNEPMAVSEDFFFYSVGNETGAEDIRRYDVRTEKEESFLSSEEIDKQCEAFVKKQGGKFADCYLTELFCYQDRLYVQVQIDWTKENRYRMNHVIFCVDTAGKSGLRIAEDWMSFIRTNSGDETIDEKVEGCDSVIFNASRGAYLVDGKVIMILTSEKGVGIGCYDLEKKTGKVVKEGKDNEYFLPFYDNNNEDEYSDDVYSEWMMDGGMSLVPEELEFYWGC